jgi:hypothetical protein
MLLIIHAQKLRFEVDTTQKIQAVSHFSNLQYITKFFFLVSSPHVRNPPTLTWILIGE